MIFWFVVSSSVDASSRFGGARLCILRWLTFFLGAWFVLSHSFFALVCIMPLGWKEFVLEFRTPANNLVSLFQEKRFLSWGCEKNLCSWSLESSHGWILDTDHGCRECLGKRLFVCENPLKSGEPLGGFGRSSLNFFNKDV